MALLVTLFLVLTTIYGSADNLSPVSTSTNMLALWLIVCIFFVYGALIAYAIILLVRYKLQSEKYVTYYNKWLKVFDLSLLIIFPIFFGIFNFIYWYHVSTISEVWCKLWLKYNFVLSFKYSLNYFKCNNDFCINHSNVQLCW